MSLSEDIIKLQELIASGTLDKSIGVPLVARMEKEKKEEILRRHPWTISQGKDGK